MATLFSKYLKIYKDLDYVASWFIFIKAAEYIVGVEARTNDQVEVAFVCTNSISQGEQVGMLWPILFTKKLRIKFAHTSFTWTNNASHNAGVTCIIVGLEMQKEGHAMLYRGENRQTVSSIGPYLVPGTETIVTKSNFQISGLPAMSTGNKPTDEGNFMLTLDDTNQMKAEFPEGTRFIRRIAGSKEFIRGESRWCLWIENDELQSALRIRPIFERIERVRKFRKSSRGKQANDAATIAHRFVYAPHKPGVTLLVPNVSSERRPYLPCILNLLDCRFVVGLLSGISLSSRGVGGML